MADQKIKTYYDAPAYPGTRAREEPSMQRHMDRQQLNRQKRAEQSGFSGAFRSFGGRLKRNFVENMHRPMFSEEAPRKTPKAQKSHGRTAPQHAPSRGRVPDFYPRDLYWDLSMHPDPMVSGMYREEREPSRKRRKESRGGGTEIHYHYHY